MGKGLARTLRGCRAPIRPGWVFSPFPPALCTRPEVSARSPFFPSLGDIEKRSRAGGPAPRASLPFSPGRRHSPWLRSHSGVVALRAPPATRLASACAAQLSSRRWREGGGEGGREAGRARRGRRRGEARRGALPRSVWASAMRKAEPLRRQRRGARGLIGQRRSLRPGLGERLVVQPEGHGPRRPLSMGRAPPPEGPTALAFRCLLSAPAQRSAQAKSGEASEAAPVYSGVRPGGALTPEQACKRLQPLR